MKDLPIIIISRKVIEVTTLYKDVAIRHSSERKKGLLYTTKYNGYNDYESVDRYDFGIM